jgi:hypothetical protein
VRKVGRRATQLSIVTDRATRLNGLTEPGGERIRFDSRIELLRMISAGLTPVEVFMIRCTMGSCS